MNACILAEDTVSLPCGYETSHLLPVIDRPVVWHQMNMLKDWGVTRVCFADKTLKGMLSKVLANGDRWGVSISFESPWEEAEQSSNEVSSNDFDHQWIILSPGWVGMGILPEAHESSDCAGSIVSHVDEHGEESGIWMTSSQTFHGLAGTLKYCESPTEKAFRKAVASFQCERVESTSFLMKSSVIALKDFISTNKQALSGILPLMSKDTTEIKPGILVGAGVTIDPTAKLIAPVYIGDGCIVSAGAVLEGAVIGSGTAIGKDCVIQDSIIDGDTFVGNVTEVTDGFASRNRLQREDMNEHLVVEDPFLLSDITVPMDMSAKEIAKGLYDLVVDQLTYRK